MIIRLRFKIKYTVLSTYFLYNSALYRPYCINLHLLLSYRLSFWLNSQKNIIFWMGFLSEVWMGSGLYMEILRFICPWILLRNVYQIGWFFISGCAPKNLLPFFYNFWIIQGIWLHLNKIRFWYYSSIVAQL